MAIFKLKSKKYSDVQLVEGMFLHQPKMESACCKHCKSYFNASYRGVFFVGDEHKDEIFQESFITLWRNIEKRKIYVEDGQLKGKDGEPFTGSLTTYFMSIARLKYLEWTRKKSKNSNSDNSDRLFDQNDKQQYMDILYDADDTSMADVIADCISRMSENCKKILTLFYYQHKTLDEIIQIMTSYKSKDALKTAKYKCMNTLKTSAVEIHKRYINA